MTQEQVPEAAALARACGARVIGLHAHSGSGIYDATLWARHARLLAALAQRHFPDTVRILNLGGGFGVSDAAHPERHLDLVAVNAHIREALSAIAGPSSCAFELWLEPGRYLVAVAGVLLAHVTQIKQKHDQRYVGVTAGMHTLIRPALYGARHCAHNLSRLDVAREQLQPTILCGPICESGDVFERDALLPVSLERGRAAVRPVRNTAGDRRTAPRRRAQRRAT